MMSYLEALRWDMVSAVFQLALCAAILGAWLRQRIRRRSATRGASSASPPAFSMEVMLQSIRLQTEHALLNILSTVEAERDKLQHALAGAGALHPAAEPETAGPAAVPVAFRWGDAEAEEQRGNRYAGLNGLAEQGLSPRQIADRLNVPAGEIELALKMRAAAPENDLVREIRQ
jgi:hypothetical protein